MVQPGDELTIAARDWNTLLEMAADYRLGGGAGKRNLRNSTSRGVVVPVKNNTGDDLARYHAMGIGTPLFTHTDNAQTFLNDMAFNGESQSNVYLGQFAVAQESIPDGKIGNAMIHGVTVAEITVGDATHTHVDVDGAGGTKLVSGFAGSGQIIYKESGTGTKWSIIRISAGVAAEDEETGTGTGTGTDDICISRIGGVTIANLPIDSNPSYALGIDSTGCLVLIPIGTC